MLRKNFKINILILEMDNGLYNDAKQSYILFGMLLIFQALIP